MSILFVSHIWQFLINLISISSSSFIFYIRTIIFKNADTENRNHRYRKIARIIPRFAEWCCNFVRKRKARHLHKVLVSMDDKSSPISITMRTIAEILFEVDRLTFVRSVLECFWRYECSYLMKSRITKLFFWKIDRHIFLVECIFKFNRSNFIYSPWMIFIRALFCACEYINLYPSHVFN